MAVNDEKPTREEVLALYGETMLAVQQLEEAMVGLIGVHQELCVLLQADPNPEDVEGLERFWEDLFAKKTAGQLRDLLELEGELCQEMESAVLRGTFSPTIICAITRSNSTKGPGDPR